MKITASFNLFDGYEFIELILREIRPYVDHISVVYQEQSNTLAVVNPDVPKLIEYLINQKVIDEAVLFVPDEALTPNQLECNKRNIGYNIARRENADYYLTADADELYLGTLFNEVYLDSKPDAVFAPIRTYYKFVEKYYDEQGTFYIPFLQKVRDDVNFSGRNPRVNLVDPTRILPYKTHTVLKNRVHHFSYIRTHDFYSKFHAGSNAKNARRFYKALKEAYDNFTVYSSEAVILKNWSHLETIKVQLSNTMLFLLRDYEWNNEQRIYSKRSI